MPAPGNEASLSAIFRGRRVLLTGHTGFKGGWLALWLQRLGATVVGVSLPPSSPSLHAALGMDELIDGRIGDIRAPGTFAEAIDGETFDLVIHMAAQSLVRTSYEMPVDTYLTNVVGTAVVLDAARRMHSLRGVVVVTSDKCYDNREWVWGYRETDPMGGRDPYSASKGCAELVAASYRSSFFSDPDGAQIATVRAGNVIGGGDWGADRLIPDLMRSVQWGVPARLRNPRSIRPWQHVFEPLRGYLMLAAALLQDGARYAGGWNFGPASDATVEVGKIADRAVTRWDGECPDYLVERRTKDPSEAIVLRLDSSKANVQLGWKPLLDIEQAVDMSVDWYRQYARDPRDMRSFSIDQIDRYVDLWHGAPSAMPENLVRTEVASCV